MRRIYFVADKVTHLSVPNLSLSLELWESSYELIMSKPVGKSLHNLWRHHFGAEAEMRISGKDLRKLENGIKKLMSGCSLSAELHDFLGNLTIAAMDARTKGYDMVVIAE